LTEIDMLAGLKRKPTTI